MRFVTRLQNDDDVTRSFDNEAACDELKEPERNLASLSNYLTENKMAAVFPVLASSGSVESTRNKNGGGSGAQRKTEQLVDASEATSRVRNNGIAIKESLVPVNSQEDTCCHLNKNNNGISSEPASDSLRRPYCDKQDYKKPAEHLEGSKGKISSGFQDKVVTACIEQRSADTNDAICEAVSGNVKNRSSHDSETGDPREDDKSERKLFKHSVYTTKISGETRSPTPSHALSSHTMPGVTTTQATNKTISDAIDPVQATMKTISDATDPVQATMKTMPDATVPASLAGVKDNIKNKQNFQAATDVVPDTCSGLTVSPQCTTSSSAVDSPLSADDECDTALVHNKDSQVNVTNCDDIITSEVMSRSPKPGRSDAPGSSDQDGAGKRRKGLSARISKRFMNLFQKHPINTPAMPDSTDKESQGRCSDASGTKNPGKKSTRQSSFAGRLMTSVAEWRRKPPNQVKKSPRNKKKKNSDIEDTSEPQNNNTGRVPIFVSWQDQAEIVEDAPVGIMEEQKIILRDSWSVIKSDVAEVGVETFMGLFHTHPDSIDAFLAFKDKAVEDIEQSAVLKAHALRVMQTVDKCITRLDDLDKMAAIVCQLGRRHIGYKANANLVPLIGKQFISAIEPKMADRWSDEVCKAWDSLFRNINYNLRRGMMQEKHRLQDEATTKKGK